MSAADADTASAHTHEGWWCNEHGVPEEVCALCSPKLVAEFKDKGDWCDEHNRPESQCFICHPEKEAEFAALYEAKYGTQPPKPAAESDEEHAAHEHHDHT
jgi:cobalt-zinc-cadmium efflux system membrane fusion protein